MPFIKFWRNSFYDTTTSKTSKRRPTFFRRSLDVSKTLFRNLCSVWDMSSIYYRYCKCVCEQHESTFENISRHESEKIVKEYLPIWGIERESIGWRRNSGRFALRKSSSLPAQAGRSWTWYCIPCCRYRRLETISRRGSRAATGSVAARTTDIPEPVTSSGTLSAPRIPPALRWYFRASRTWWGCLEHANALVALSHISCATLSSFTLDDYVLTGILVKRRILRIIINL